MKNYSAFDILGPIMIGPSSSHTAGAVRLGRIAREIAGDSFFRVDFYLHGSFAKTYKGHGTDRALAAGALGMNTDDERIKNALTIAKESGITINFIETELNDEHPNTVKAVFYLNDGNTVEVTGSSIGGGNIIVTDIDGDRVEIDGNYPTIAIKHNDKEGMISRVSSVLAMGNINIASMKVGRKEKRKEAYMIIEADNFISEKTLKFLEGVDGIISVRYVNPI